MENPDGQPNTSRDILQPKGQGMNESAMTLGADYDGQDPLGWFVSEKLRGVRAYWDGATLWTRGGFVVDVPSWFTAGLPKFHLDGEIYAGRCMVETVARLAVQNGRWIEGVHTFQIFDAPQFAGTWPERMTTAATIIQNAPHARPVEFSTITDRRELFARLQAVQSGGGEGLMIRHPAVTHYERGRTANLLKVKGAHPAMFTLQFTRTTRYHRVRGKSSNPNPDTAERKRAHEPTNNNPQRIYT